MVIKRSVKGLLLHYLKDVFNTFKCHFNIPEPFNKPLNSHEWPMIQTE